MENELWLCHSPFFSPPKKRHVELCTCAMTHPDIAYSACFVYRNTNCYGGPCSSLNTITNRHCWFIMRLVEIDVCSSWS